MKKSIKNRLVNTAKNSVKQIAESLGYEFTVNRLSNNDSDSKPVVFVHIPKCGGISVDRALREQFARAGEKKIKRKPLIETSLFNFNKDIITLDDKCDFSEFHCQQIQPILTYHLNLNWHYISGHFNVTNKILEKYSEQYQFVTLLRDPVERFISNYIFNRLTNEMAIMPPSKSSKPMTKEELCYEADELINSRRGWHMANTMTMFLTGRYPKDKTDAESMQEEVLTNLAQFSVVGLLNEMPSFEHQLNKLTGKPIQIGKHNTTKALESNDAEFIRVTLKGYFNKKEVIIKLKKLCLSESVIYKQLISK